MAVCVCVSSYLFSDLCFIGKNCGTQGPSWLWVGSLFSARWIRQNVRTVCSYLKLPQDGARDPVIHHKTVRTFSWFTVPWETQHCSAALKETSLLSTRLLPVDTLNSPKKWRTLFPTGAGLWLQCLTTSPRPIIPYQRARRRSRKTDWQHLTNIRTHPSSMGNHISYFRWKKRFCFKMCAFRISNIIQWVSMSVLPYFQ